MAASLTSLLLGIDLSQYRISYDVGGRGDGPSAGGLLTVALIANLFGDSVKPDATMTGQINPDGTIGPVGGIPQKIDAAVRIGKKLILVPYGQRFNTDLKTNQLVDVVERGRSLGAEVRVKDQVISRRHTHFSPENHFLGQNQQAILLPNYQGLPR